MDSYDNGYLTAEFESIPPVYYSVNIESANYYQGDVSPFGPNSILAGNSISVKAIPKSGFAFKQWYVNGSPTSNPASFNFQPSQNSTLTAYFVAQYTVTVQSEDTNKGTAEVFGGGTVATVTDGNLVSVLAYPKSGYVFEGWYENGFMRLSGLTNYLYLPFATCTLVAKFNAIPQYTVTVQSEDTNKGTVSGGGTCYAGGNVYINASPNSGYQFEGWYLNGTKVSNLATTYYTPSASCNLVAKFSACSVSPSISISGPQSVSSGSTVQYTAVNNTGTTITAYDWTISPMGSNIIYDYGSWISIYFPSPGNFKVSLRGSNTCGWGSWYDYYVDVGNRGLSSVYPNPVSDILNIDIDATGNANARDASPSYNIRLYDVIGIQLRHTVSNGGTVQLNVSNLPNGLYYLHIYDGSSNAPEIHRIIVQH